MAITAPQSGETNSLPGSSPAEVTLPQEAQAVDRTGRLHQLLELGEVVETNPLNLAEFRPAFLVPYQGRGLRITPPITTTANAPVVAAKLGFGEHIESGIGAMYHDVLAAYNPDSAIVSIAPRAIGDTGEQVSGPLDALRFSFGHQALHSNQLLQEVCGERPVILTAKSMGTIKANLMLNNHLDGEAGGLNIAGVIYLSPALVPRKQIPQRMLIGFVPVTVADNVLQNVAADGQERARRMDTLQQSARFSKKELMAIGSQVIGITLGTEDAAIERVLQSGVKMGVIVGSWDPVGRAHYWQQLAERYPNLTVRTIKRRGHSITSDPLRSGAKVSKTRHEMNLAT